MNYIKLLNTLGKLVKEGQIKSIDEAIQMVQKMGAQVDGLLKQGIENLFKTTKARDPELFKGWTPKVIEGGKGKKGVENLFQETKKVDWKDTPLPVNPKVESFYDELVENAYKESKKTGRDVREIIEETIDYKFTGNETGKEILDIIEKKFFKADGGRIGYNIGGNIKRNVPYDSRASVADYARSLQNVSGGTDAQKRADLSRYIQSYTPKSASPALATASQFAQGILGVDLGTPQTKSMTEFLQKTIQDKISKSGNLKGSIDYRDYGVQTGPKGQHPYGKGDVSFNSPEFALATTLGKADYAVDPKTGKVTWTGGTPYDFPEQSLPFGLAEFINKGGIFGQKLDYSPDVTLGADFMKQYNKPKYPDYKTAALQSQYYKDNPSSLDSDLWRAAYARALPNSGIQTKVLSDGQLYTDYGNYDPSRVYSAYMSDRGTSSSNPFFDQFQGSQYADMPAIMKAMYGAPGNINPYYKAGGRVGYANGGLNLTGQAKNIYDSWISAGHSSEDALNYLSSRGLYDAGGGGIESVVNTQQSIIPQSGGNGDNRGGGGKWGNLDTSKTKTFDKQVWEVGGPANQYGSWVDKEVTGYYNPTTGQYQTWEGKNINHAGWFTGDPEAGDIKGEFTEFPGLINLGINAFKGIRDKFTNWRANQNKIAQENLQKEIDEANKQAAIQAKIESEIAAGKSLSQIGRENFTGEGQAFEQRRGTTTKKDGQTFHYGGRKYGGLMLKDGGLATMFTRRR